MALAPAAHLAGELDDRELLGRALGGDVGAFDTLYRRHVDVAHRVARLHARDEHDASDAVSDAFTKVFRRIREGRLRSDVDFRPYVLTAVRNAAVDQHRKAHRTKHSDVSAEVIDLRTAERVTTPAEVLVGSVDAGMVSRAFAELPGRWQSVLWLTEVEGLDPRHAAEHLGLSANNTAQLASRARQRLREHWLQAHLDDDVADRCRFTVEHLGAYVGGQVSARDLAKIDQHLMDCGECRDRLDELQDVGSTLRRAAIPLPLVLGSSAGVLGAAGIVASGSAGTVLGGAAAAGRGLASVLSRPPTWLQAGLGAAAAGLLVVGATAVVQHDPDPSAPAVVLGERTSDREPGPVEADGELAAPVSASNDLDRLVVRPRLVTDDGTDGDGDDDGAPGDDGGEPIAGETPPPPVDPEDPTEPAPLAEVGVGGSVLGVDVGLVVGSDSLGVEAGPVQVGDEAPAPAEGGSVRITTDGTVLPPLDLGL